MAGLKDKFIGGTGRMQTGMLQTGIRCGEAEQEAFQRLTEIQGRGGLDIGLAIQGPGRPDKYNKIYKILVHRKAVYVCPPIGPDHRPSSWPVAPWRPGNGLASAEG